MAFTAVGFTGILVLIADVVVGGAAPAVMGWPQGRESPVCGLSFRW